ncbi:hypothetical protein KB206_15440 [Microvirga sp. STS02]|uniref:hypothetical protein n=1 Tax=Hymenobacter negativus TaxID=2795026 RepID=UPI0018DDC909|nr:MULTISPECIES: hypothetical protein [Bacteria]MBH8570284.1 hypothetical protein [Hymenobacter negativus]MBR7210023.1 hypothetical protein [Microvirga sp. STS02]
MTRTLDNHIIGLNPRPTGTGRAPYEQLSQIEFIKRKLACHASQRRNQLLKGIIQIERYFLLIILSISNIDDIIFL